jgi:UDP-glucose 4-epimerase
VGRDAGAMLRADFSMPGSVDALDLRGFDAIVHCAGIVDEDFTPAPSHAFVQATQGMEALVKRARGCGVTRFAYVSSAHVYGPLVGRIDETSAPNPLSDYAIAHFASEQILRRSTGGGFRGAVFRPCAVFGIPPDLERFRRWTLIPFEFPRSAIIAGAIVLKSSGDNRRNFVGAIDVARAVGTWVSSQEEAAEFIAINPIGKATLSVREFADLCANICREEFGKPCEVRAPADMPAVSNSQFYYATRHPRYAGAADLRATVGALMSLLSR